MATYFHHANLKSNLCLFFHCIFMWENFVLYYPFWKASNIWRNQNLTQHQFFFFTNVVNLYKVYACFIAYTSFCTLVRHKVSGYISVGNCNSMNKIMHFLPFILNIKHFFLFASKYEDHLGFFLASTSLVLYRYICKQGYNMESVIKCQE